MKISDRAKRKLDKKRLECVRLLRSHGVSVKDDIGVSELVDLGYVTIGRKPPKKASISFPSAHARMDVILKRLLFGTVKRRPKDKSFVNSKEFLAGYSWRKLRLMALKKHGARCQCCGQSSKDGVVIHVDHIKPRRKYPELALDINNLQVLCEVCNHGKGNWDETDWREPRLSVLMGERTE